jgi:hypothetical protein
MAKVFTQLGSEGWELLTVGPMRFDLRGFYLFKRAIL